MIVLMLMVVVVLMVVFMIMVVLMIITRPLSDHDVTKRHRLIARGIGALDYKVILTHGYIGRDHDLMMMDMCITLASHIIPRLIEGKGFRLSITPFDRTLSVLMTVKVIVYLYTVRAEPIIVR